MSLIHILKNKVIIVVKLNIFFEEYDVRMKEFIFWYWNPPQSITWKQFFSSQKCPITDKSLISTTAPLHSSTYRLIKRHYTLQRID